MQLRPAARHKQSSPNTGGGHLARATIRVTLCARTPTTSSRPPLPGDPVVARPPHPKTPWSEFGFSLNGVRTEHMFLATCKSSESWTPGQVVPHTALSIEPAATVLNYGQALFEGLKALRREDGSITLFRPEMNARRMARGAERLCIPPVRESGGGESGTAHY